MTETNRLLSGLSLDRLRNFLAVAEKGSLSKAAVQGEKDKGQMCRQIRDLEEFFGVELTRSRGKGIRITEAGRELAVLVRRHLVDLGDFLRKQQGVKKVFRIGASESVLQWVVLPKGAGIRQALDGAALSFASLQSEEIVEEVREGRLDFGIVPEDAIPRGMARRKLGQLVLRLCVPKELKKRYREGDKDGGRGAEGFSPFPFAVSHGRGALDGEIRAELKKVLGEFQPAYACESLVQVRECVAAGLAAGVLPSLGTKGLKEMGVGVGPFAVENIEDVGEGAGGMGLSLCLHWNERHLRRRGVLGTGREGNKGVSVDAVLEAVVSNLDVTG